MPIPHLPSEIHIIISSHLATEDLLNYRCASKRLAEIGAQFLFRHITFHASHASLIRTKVLGHHNDLKKWVRTVTWNTSSLDMGVNDFQEWLNHVTSLRSHELDEIRKAWGARVSDETGARISYNGWLMEQYERYTMLLAEEKSVQENHLGDIFFILGAFPKVNTIVVEKIQYDNPEITSENVELDSMELVPRGMWQRYRRVRYRHFDDMAPLAAALRAAQYSTRKIEARNVHFTVFDLTRYIEYLKDIPVSQITHLDLRFPMEDPTHEPMCSGINMMNCRVTLYQGHFKHFLQNFESLEVLHLDFEGRSHGNGTAPVDLADVYEVEQGTVWPKLKDLAIRHADAPAPTVIGLLSSHAATLKKLALGDICLDPSGSWETILTNFQSQASLESAEFSYFLFDARIESSMKGRSAMVGWYVDSQKCRELGKSDMGERLVNFMVKGGSCPLLEEKKTVRVIGKLQDGNIDDWLDGRHVSVVT